MRRGVCGQTRRWNPPARPSAPLKFKTNGYGGWGGGGWGEGGGELPETVEMLRFIFHHLNFCSAPDLIIVI